MVRAVKRSLKSTRLKKNIAGAGAYSRSADSPKDVENVKSFFE
jgi:hypothetical protein